MANNRQDVFMHGFNFSVLVNYNWQPVRTRRPSVAIPHAETIQVSRRFWCRIVPRRR